MEKWIPGCTSTIILTGKDPLDGPQPLILSYELAALHAKTFKKMKFEMVICDESHYLKSHRTKTNNVML